jgi:hypothetical protein
MMATTIINSTSVNPDLGERMAAVLSAEIGHRSSGVPPVRHGEPGGACFIPEPRPRAPDSIGA